MYVVLLVLHVLISLVLMITVLLQSGRGGGLAGAFGGGGGSQAIFGGRGAATFLSKATTVLGASFMVTSLLLAVLSSHRFEGGKSALERAAERATTEQPTALPGPGESGFPAAPPAGGEGGTPEAAPGGSTPGGGAPGAGTTGPAAPPLTMPPSGQAPAGGGGG